MNTIKNEKVITESLLIEADTALGEGGAELDSSYRYVYFEVTYKIHCGSYSLSKGFKRYKDDSCLSNIKCIYDEQNFKNVYDFVETCTKFEAKIFRNMLNNLHKLLG